MSKKRNSQLATPKSTNSNDELKKQNQELQKKITELNNIIEGYQAGEIGAEGRIKTLTEMQSNKVKMLLRSIDQLKKDLIKERSMQKDNVKAKLMDQYKKDIESQDFIISTLRALVGDEDKCDRALLAQLNKGPDRIRSATREELKMENSKLRGLLQACKEKQTKLELQISLNKQGVQPREIQKSKDAENNSTEYNKKAIDLEAELDDLKLKSTTEINEKTNNILELTKVLNDCKVELKGKDDKIQRLNDALEKSYAATKEKASFENEVNLLRAKCKALEKELEKSMRESVPRVDKEGDISKNEIELQNSEMLEEIKRLKLEIDQEKGLAKDQVGILENENKGLKDKIEELENTLKKLETEKGDKESMVGSLQQKISLHEENFEQQKKSIEESYNQLVNQLNTVNTEKNMLNEKYMKTLERLEELETQLQDKELEIEVYQAKLEEHDKEFANGKLGIGEAEDTLMAGDKATEISELKNTIKELKRREVELLEQLDEYQAKEKDNNENKKEVVSPNNDEINDREVNEGPTPNILMQPSEN